MTDKKRIRSSHHFDEVVLVKNTPKYRRVLKLLDKLERMF